jgi:tetratricopeptide (TPR) repeat protein
MLASRTVALGVFATLVGVSPWSLAQRPASPKARGAQTTPAAAPAPVVPGPELATGTGDDPARTAHAKGLFEKAANAYAAGKYYDAIESFLELDRFYPTNQLPFNIAKAYDNLGSKPGALRFYREYLRRSPEAADKDSVVARIRELEAALAERGVQQMSVSSDPPDATVLLDDRPVGLTPWTGETWPGRHRVVVRKEGYTDRELTVELEPLKSAEVNAELLRAPLAVAAPQPKPASAEKPWPLTRRMSVLTWTTLATGTAALGTAIAVEVSAGAKGSRITPATGFFAGVGTAAAIVGGVMLYFDLSDKAGDERHASVDAGPDHVLARYRTSF